MFIENNMTYRIAKQFQCLFEGMAQKTEDNLL